MADERFENAQVLALLDARIQHYKPECIAIVEPTSVDDVKNGLWDALEADLPCSVYLILLAMRWCLNKHAQTLKESFVIDMIVEDILNSTDDWWIPVPDVNDDNATSMQEGERLRTERQATFDQWPVEDCAAIYAWLKLVETSPGVLQDDPTSIQKVTRYWQGRLT